MSSRRRAVAVVGAAGHVGRHLVGRLEEEGFDVHAVDRGDDLSAAVQSLDAIVHLAGTLKPVGGDSYRDANVATVERTLTAARDAAVRRLVFLSYPGADPDSSNEYLRTKGEAEALLRLSGIETVILRSTFIFGPPDDPGPSIVPFLAHNGKPVGVIGSGHQRYQPVFVGDVVRAIIRALDPSIPCATYALAGPRALTVDEFVSLLNHGEAGERHLAAPIAKAIALVAPSLTRAMVDVLSADSVPDAPPAWGLFGIEPQSLDALYLAGAVSH